jgi:7-cyano-7-deazaguanine synthase in queuosine biosynthesis
MNMTPEQAKIIILENALIRAIQTVEFLHGCLTEPSCDEVSRVVAAAINVAKSKTEQSGYSGHSYAYPNTTELYLAKWKQLVHVPKGCHHSYYAPDRNEPCEACDEAMARHNQIKEAKAVLGEMLP